MKPTSNHLQWGLLVVAPLCWSGNFVLGRLFSGDIDPYSLVVIRWGGATLLFAPFFLTALYKKRHVLYEHWKMLLWLSFLGVSTYNTLVYIGLKSTLASNAGILNSTIPIFTLLLSTLVLSEKINKMQLFGIALSITGVLALISKLQLSALYNFRINEGDYFILIAAVTWASYSFCLRYRPAALSASEFFSATLLMGTFFLLILWVIMDVEFPPVQNALLGFYGYVILIPSILAFLSYNHCIQVFGANFTSQSIHLMPLFIAILSIIFLNEQLGMHHLIGAMLILSGIAISQFKKTRPSGSK